MFLTSVVKLIPMLAMIKKGAGNNSFFVITTVHIRRYSLCSTSIVSTLLLTLSNSCKCYSSEKLFNHEEIVEHVHFKLFDTTLNR